MLGLSALAAVVLSFLIVNYYSRQIDGQNERNQFLEQRIAQVQKQIDEIKTLDEKKARLLKRKDIIEDLQADRSQMVHLFDSLVRTIPDGVVLTSIKQEGDKLSLEGRSQSNARVSAYMRSLEGSGWMTQPQLSIIEAKEGDPGLPFTFSMSVTLANPNAPKDADGDGKPDEAPAAVPAGSPAPAAAPAAAPSTAGAAS
jgi:type IV pilus assembly protein PilN